MKRRVLILEDLPSARESLARIIRAYSEDLMVYEFGDAAEALEFAMGKRVDLFLVDIILKPKVPNDFSGITFVKSIRTCPEYASAEIVFITALAGLEAELLHMVHCFDYIEKPIRAERVQRMIDEVLTKMNGKNIGNELVFLRKDRVTYPVYENRIIYAENRKKILYVYTVEGVIETPNLSLKKFLERIRTQSFASPTKGIAVNVDFIEYIDTTNRFVKMRGVDTLIDIGVRMRGSFLSEIQRCEGTDIV